MILKKRAKKKPPGEGDGFEFHGAYNHKADAQRRAKQKSRKGRSAFVRLRKMPWGSRYVVMLPNETPF